MDSYRPGGMICKPNQLVKFSIRTRSSVLS